MRGNKGVTRKMSIYRDSECHRLRKTGESYKSIGIKLGISRQAVHQRLKRPSYANAGRRKAKDIKKRHMTVAYLLLNGYRRKDIAAALDMSVSNIYLIIKKYNLEV